MRTAVGVTERQGATRLRTGFPHLRKLYQLRLAFRLCLLALTIVMYFVYPESFNVLEGLDFFRRLSWLHLPWFVWSLDIVSQLIPQNGLLPLGSLKQFETYYKPFRKLGSKDRLRTFFKKSGIDSLKVFGMWVALIILLGLLWNRRLLGDRELLLCTVVLYALDLVFVLFWCPLRAWILKNRCCTTCRIFNWDHLMIFSPLLFVPGFYSISLICLAVIVFAVWESRFVLHPERFCEDTNEALRCKNCTDVLCGRG